MNLKINKVIRIEEVTLGIDDEEGILKSKIAKILDLPEQKITSYQIVKKNIDSRQKNILFVYSLDVQVENIEAIKKWDIRHRVRTHEPFVYQELTIIKKINKKIVVVGSGPCGLFACLLLAKAGLKPLLIEQGKDVETRIQDVNNFFKERKFNPKSNIQFGEGGAGTFSDGKLYTLINDPRSKYVFTELIKAGAPEEIAISATPHIGTDKLRAVIKNIRTEIIKLGGEVRFETCLTDLEIKTERLKAIILNKKEKIKVDELILATGHSARDTYQMLYERKLKMSAKAFSIGLRIEHEAIMINKAQYGSSYNHPKLNTARYKLVQHLDNKRPVYSFCMCPGGYVMGAASEEGRVVTNGMSEYAQNGINSNSALLVPVTPADFESNHPLAGIEFQRKFERAAYLAGGSNYFAPAQLLGDFLKGQASKEIKSIKPSYKPGIKLTTLDSCLPDYVISSLKAAIPLFERKIKGFSNPEAILTGVETRSSAPVRILRNENCESNILGIYPAGEGAGYAGGIVSSAIDGLNIAEIIIEKYKKRS
ncbi:MAG: FAD-dependent oxidoreductase [Patescibacteria group bacterium]